MLALLRQLNIGFVLVIAGGMLVSFRGPSGLSVVTVMIALMLVLWFLDMLIVQRDIRLVRSFVIVPAVVFLVISIGAFVIGQIPWFVFARQAPLDAQLGGFSIFALSIGGMLLSAHLVKDIRWLKTIVWSFIVLSSIYIVFRAVNQSAVMRLYHAGVIGQSMFWTWLVALLFGQVIYNSDLPGRAKLMLIVLVLLTFYDTAYQAYDWKSGWVPPLVVVGILLGFRYPKLWLVGTPFIGFVAFYMVMKLIGAEDYSWGTRVDAWKIVLEIARVSPLLGMGFANYYWYTPLFPIRGYAVSFNSHSQYVDLIAQTGYLGLIAFLWLFFVFGKLSFDIASRLPDGFERAYCYSVFAGIAATLVAAFLGDWVLPFVYNIGLTGFRASILPWIFMGGVVAIQQIKLNSVENNDNEHFS